MLVLVALVLLVVLGVAVAGNLGAGREERSLFTGLAAVLGVGLVVVLAALAVVGVGLRGGSDAEDEGAARAETTTSTAAERVKTTAIEPAPARDGQPNRPVDLHLAAPVDGTLPRPAPVVPIGELRGSGVLLVEAEGLAPVKAGVAYQCARASCGAAVPVHTDAAGIARFLFDFEPCRDGCRFVVEVGGRVTAAFRDSARAAPTLTIDGVAAVRDGDRVRVTVEGLDPGEHVIVTQCGAVVEATNACGGSIGAADAHADSRGRVQVEYTVSTGDAGRDVRSPCRRGDACAIAVLGDGGEVRAAVAPLTFAGGGTADYEAGRVAVGLLVAVACLAFGWWVVRRTDWTPLGLPSTTDDAPDPF